MGKRRMSHLRLGVREWPSTMAHGGRCLRGNAAATGKVAELIRQRGDELALLDAVDGGKPLKDNKYGDLPLCVRIFEYYSGVPDKYPGKTYPSENGMFNFSVREPFGVVAGIVPWNYPLLNSCIKLAPALAAGNTVVLKMAEQTPLIRSNSQEFVRTLVYLRA